MVVTDLLAVFSFKSSAAPVSVLIGLFTSEVLSTLLSAKLVFAAATVLAPVPPFAMATVPVNLLALRLMILASVIDASAIAVVAIAASTYVLTAFCVGNKISLLPSAVVTDLLTVFSFKSSAAWVSVLMGLFTSVVLSTLLSAKLVFAAATLLAPVPPLATGTTPVNFEADRLIIFESVIDPSVTVTPATAAST